MFASGEDSFGGTGVRFLLPLPTTQEWGEDRGEGPSKTNAPPLLHPLEEREYLRFVVLPRRILRADRVSVVYTDAAHEQIASTPPASGPHLRARSQ